MEPSRIFVDGFNLTLEQGTGVATYARNLAAAVGGLGHRTGVLYGRRAGAFKDPLAREVAFFDPRSDGVPKWKRTWQAIKRTARRPGGQPAVRVPITGAVVSRSLPPVDEIWNVRDLFGLADMAFDLFGGVLPVRFPPQAGPAVMHWTYPVPVRAVGAKNVYTLHDLVPLRLPFTTLDNKRRYLRLCRRIAAQADLLLTVSECSRQDIVGLLGVAPERVVNTYQSVEVDPKYLGVTQDEIDADLAGSFGLTAGGYFLFFGAIEPKKNVGRMIEAYLASGAKAPLVIVGKKAWKSEGELRLMFDDNIRYLFNDGPRTFTRHRIMLLDYAPYSLLVSLIRGARAVLFPSLYEGFGLPVLEAMQLGTPVMTSNTASLPELVGDAALAVDPYDVRAMVQAIRALDGDAELRARLGAGGPAQAALFSPERYRARLAAVYDRL